MFSFLFSNGLLTMHVPFVFILNECVPPWFSIDCIMTHNNLEIIHNLLALIFFLFYLNKECLQRIFKNSIPFLQVHRLQIPFLVLIQTCHNSVIK